MSIKTRLATAIRGLGLMDLPVPANAITVTAEHMAAPVRKTGDEDCWNAYRLGGGNESRPRSVDGKHWPLITCVTRLEKGEDDVPTIYIYAEDDPRGCFPVELDR